MSTATETSPLVEQAKRHTGMVKDRLLKTFSFVPDDKLTWSPAPTCKCALRIVAHCGNSNAAFIRIMKGIPFPATSPEEMMEMARAADEAITTREEAIALIESSTAEVLVTIDNLTPAQVDSMIETPMFTAPMAFWMNLPARHMDNHASQIDMLQTCWGDMDWHM